LPRELAGSLRSRGVRKPSSALTVTTDFKALAGWFARGSVVPEILANGGGKMSEKAA